MEAASFFGYSKVLPFGFSLSNHPSFSVRPFNKHLVPPLVIKKTQNHKNITTIQTTHRSLLVTKTQFPRPIKCSYSDTTSSEPQNPLLENLKNFSLDSIKATLSSLTPIDICKWSLVFCAAIAAAKRSVNTLLSPFFWVYFSWTWLFWPWYVAVGLGIYGLYCLRKHLRSEANVFEQLAIVTSTITWLTLVPPAYFNGYLEGWPFVFCFIYHYFFFFNVSVRKRMYGDYYLPKHDPKWDISPPNWYRVLFCVGVMAAHWLAAFEAPELHLISGGWSNFWIWGLIMMCLFAQYHSTLYLANYSVKVVQPTTVVQFGPYRWVRHPIYASTMLLFATYFAALRAPLSSLFVVAVCVMYYEQKARLEEALMVENFGPLYPKYVKKVRHKFIPFVY
ncbi:protein C-terminal S-isoprenylcysteine carboxyl O-methyltransferase [Actinidia rufa]|uniref:Protein C-terminal S-isoprenylcysteine carboxyl O-methyltransferase n=1 Tax=Actinidia rufa TaxID=165716 RepID=A0A7J0H9X0_9ERIC|nr:protein C-terminal S-isoprenylcysteine carboxyl O-methyltransferase [Actinidia rufa]